MSEKIIKNGPNAEVDNLDMDPMCSEFHPRRTNINKTNTSG